MNAHLDIFGIRRPTLPVRPNWPFEAHVDEDPRADRHRFSGAVAKPQNTAVSTLTLASRSYLVPWLRAMQLSQGLGIQVINSLWLFHEPVDFFVGFGSFNGLSFASWWAQWGFAHYGWAITDVQVRYPKRRCKDWATKTRLVVEATVDAQRTLDEVEFVLTQVRHLQPGLLSSSPLLWPSFCCPLSIAKINDYLSVYEAVTALPAGQRARMLTVGNQLRLAPQALVKSTDLPKEQAQKRKVMSQVTSQYFAKGQAIVQNAARGVFPSTVPVRKGG